MKATNKPITIEEVEKIIYLLSEISFLLKAIMNTFTIQKTVINIMISENTLAKITSIVYLLSKNPLSIL